METLLVVLLFVTILLLLVLILLVLRRPKGGALSEKELRSFSAALSEEQQRTAKQQTSMIQMQFEMQSRASEQQSTQLANSVHLQLGQFEKRLATLETTNEQKLSELRLTMERQLLSLQEGNDRKLSQIQQTVDEKLQNTLNEKMRQVSAQLQEVYKGLGEMQTLAAGVGDLKKVLSNVKTRGILGEIQLGAILQEILAPEQYETNVAVVKGSRNRVEFAVKFPKDDGGFVYLPIDSKFPGDTYQHLLDAYDTGSAEEVARAAKELSDRLKQCAKDIHEKYIDPRTTTSFGILFLPFEGLYAEAVNRGMVEELQRLYQINLAGPSTMAALLNSLQMGFRTLAIQKRSHEVWQVLGAVKGEFDKYSQVLVKAQQHLSQASDDLDKLVGTRTKAVMRQLRKIELPETSAKERERLFSLDTVDDKEE